MENISEINKKKTKRIRRSLTKTKRNLKKSKINLSDFENTSKEEVEEDHSIFKNWFSNWF